MKNFLIRALLIFYTFISIAVLLTTIVQPAFYGIWECWQIVLLNLATIVIIITQGNVLIWFSKNGIDI